MKEHDWPAWPQWTGMPSASQSLLSLFPSTCFTAHFQFVYKNLDESSKKLGGKVEIWQTKVFPLGWVGIVGVLIKTKSDKVQWKQTKKINHDAHEGVNVTLLLHWRDENGEEQYVALSTHKCNIYIIFSTLFSKVQGLPDAVLNVQSNWLFTRSLSGWRPTQVGP